MSTFSSVYPFNVKLENRSFGNDVSLLYIVNKIGVTSAFQKLNVSILQQAQEEYTFNGFDFEAITSIASYAPATRIDTQTLAPANSHFKPDSRQYNLGVVVKQGVLEEQVLLSFSNTLYKAIQANLVHDNVCAVQGPFVSSDDNTLTWYCAFSKSISHTQPTPEGEQSACVLSFELDGVSAASESGSRNTQIEFLFGNVSIGAEAEKFSFKRSVSLDIINHQGQCYAPMYFGVVGENSLLNNTDSQNLSLYFQTFQNQKLTFNANTRITFTFPYTETGQDLVAFANKSAVKGYTLTDANTDYTILESQATGVIQVEYSSTQATPLELHLDTFNFTNIALSGDAGLAVIEVYVQNLPGYWDSIFQIAINKTTASIEEQLELPESSSNGRSGSSGSRIDFTTAGTNENNHYNLTIEASNGLNLYGTLPSAATGLPVRIKETDLLIPDGRLAIHGGDNYPSGKSYPNGKNNLNGNNNPNEKFNVTGDTFLDGQLCISQEVDITGSATITGDATFEGDATVNGSTAILGSVVIGSLAKPKGKIAANSETQLILKGPSSKLMQLGADSNGFGRIKTTYGMGILRGSTEIMRIGNNNENVGIGTGTPSELLDVAGNITASGSVTTTGTITSKENITTSGITPITSEVPTSGMITASSQVKGHTVVSGSGHFISPTALCLDTNSTIFFRSISGTNYKPFTDLGNWNSNGLTVKKNLTVNNNVCIGTGNPKAPLDVEATYTGSYQMSAYSYINLGQRENSGSDGGTCPSGISIIASGAIISGKLSSPSDQRIKTDMVQSDANQDLQSLRKIKVTDYQYIDTIKNGTQFRKGLIAQELEAIFPEAVSQMKGFTPDVYTVGKDFSINETKKELTCWLDKAHKFAVGDLVKLMTEDNTEQQKEVIEIIDEKAFVVKDWSEKAEGIFVFGKQVDDFRTVDYQQVAMLSVSAIQALSQEIETLKNENQTLKEQLQKEMQTLRAEMNALKTK